MSRRELKELNKPFIFCSCFMLLYICRRSKIIIYQKTQLVDRQLLHRIFERFKDCNEKHRLYAQCMHMMNMKCIFLLLKK